MKPVFLRETNAVGRMLSLRWGRLRFDLVEKSDGFRLYQIGRRRVWFACRLAANAKKPPLFLFRRATAIRWMLRDYMIGFTMEPMTLDDYWRAKGWMNSDRSMSTQTTISGSGGVGKDVPSKLKGS